MPGMRYVSLSVLSGIFRRVGGKVFSPPEVLQLPILLPAPPAKNPPPISQKQAYIACILRLTRLFTP